MFSQERSSHDQINRLAIDYAICRLRDGMVASAYARDPRCAKMTDAEVMLAVDEYQRDKSEMLSKAFESTTVAIVNEFQKYIDLIKCEDCGAANMTIYMTGVDRKRRCRKCHAEYISPNPPKKPKGKK